MFLNLKKLHGEFSIAKVEKLDDSLVDALEIQSRQFWTVAQTLDEISIVSAIAVHPSFLTVEGPWSAFKIDGQLDFSLTGILSRCSTLLAEEKISVFAVSTFDTDYFLVRKETEDSAVAAWRTGGIHVALNETGDFY